MPASSPPVYLEKKRKKEKKKAGWGGGGGGEERRVRRADFPLYCGGGSVVNSVHVMVFKKYIYLPGSQRRGEEVLFEASPASTALSP